MTVLSDADLYLRGAKTLVASWEEYARGTVAAALERLPGVAAAVFPNEPERAVYNNALLQPDLDAGERARALDATEATYAAAGVTRFATWVHESDETMRGDLEGRGYALDELTRAMGMVLDHLQLPRPELELGSPDWSEYLRIVGVPPDFLSGADQSAFYVLVGRLDGENVATAMAFDLDGDCGIYNLGTLEHARRRGLGTALTALHLHNALGRGCRTASLQSTEIRGRVHRLGLPRPRPDSRVRPAGQRLARRVHAAMPPRPPMTAARRTASRSPGTRCGADWKAQPRGLTGPHTNLSIPPGNLKP